jgi:hypothetical protein
VIQTQTKTYEEIITYEQYLAEQRQLGIQVEQPEAELNQQEQQADPPCPEDTLLSISYKSTDTLKNLIISPMERAS